MFRILYLISYTLKCIYICIIEKKKCFLLIAEMKPHKKIIKALIS